MEAFDQEIDVLVTVMCWAAAIVQASYLRSALRGDYRGPAVAALRCIGWLYFGVRFVSVLHTTGDIKLPVLSAFALIILATCEIASAISRKAPL